MYPSINIPAVTGKIYGIIEKLTDVVEELNKAPLSAQICGLEGVKGVEGVGLEGDGGGSEGEGEAATGEQPGFIESPEKGPGIPESKDSDLFRYLSSNEGLELIRLESTRQSLLRAQGFLEEKKQVLIRLARSRQIGK